MRACTRNLRYCRKGSEAGNVYELDQISRHDLLDRWTAGIGQRRPCAKVTGIAWGSVRQSMRLERSLANPVPSGDAQVEVDGRYLAYLLGVLHRALGGLCRPLSGQRRVSSRSS